MHIGVDMDDVLLDLSGGLRRSVKLEFDLDVPKEDFMDRYAELPDGRQLWGPDVLGHYTDAESWLRDRYWLWSTFNAIPGSMGALRELRKAGHYLEIVTKKPQWAEAITWKWLGKWRPPVNAVTILGLDGDKAAATKADVLIDDRTEACVGFAETGRRAIIFGQPWNSLNPPVTSDIKWCSGWRSCMEVLKEWS